MTDSKSEMRDRLGELSQAVYGRKSTVREWLGGSDALILHDAAERIAKLTAERNEALRENERLESVIRAHEGEAEFSRQRSILLAEALREVERLKEESSNRHERALSLAREADRLEAQLDALQWQPITESNLPKVGDELWGGRIVMALPEHYAPMVPMVEDFTFAGWTHFRPINPPAQEPK